MDHLFRQVRSVSGRNRARGSQEDKPYQPVDDISALSESPQLVGEGNILHDRTSKSDNLPLQ